MKTKMESINWFQTTYQVQQKHRHSIVSWPSVSMKFFKHHSEVLSQVGAERTILVNLSKDVFERRTSTGSGLFSFLDSGFAHLLGQLVSIIVKTLRNTNLGASRCFKMKKTSLPVDMRRSKTPLLKLPLKHDDGDVNENWQNNDTARPSSFFVYFFGVTARLRRKNASRILRLSFRIQLHKNCQQLTNWTRWKKRDKAWSSAISNFNWRYWSRDSRCCLKATLFRRCFQCWDT